MALARIVVTCSLGPFHSGVPRGTINSVILPVAFASPIPVTNHRFCADRPQTPIDPEVAGFLTELVGSVICPPWRRKIDTHWPSSRMTRCQSWSKSGAAYPSSIDLISALEIARKFRVQPVSLPTLRA